MVLPLHIRANLVTLYNEPHRVYHNLSHVYDCLNVYRHTVNVPSSYGERVALQTAIWFHDAIYDPLSNQNEEETRDLLLSTKPHEWLPSHDVTVLAIEMSKHHSNPKKDEMIGKHETVKLFMDIDCSILGRDPNSYINYAKKVRQEFSMIPDHAYFEGRQKFLEDMLNLPAVYLTYEFKTKYEAQARRNLENELRDPRKFLFQ